MSDNRNSNNDDVLGKLIIWLIWGTIMVIFWKLLPSMLSFFTRYDFGEWSRERLVVPLAAILLLIFLPEGYLMERIIIASCVFPLMIYHEWTIWKRGENGIVFDSMYNGTPHLKRILPFKNTTIKTFIEPVIPFLIGFTLICLCILFQNEAAIFFVLELDPKGFLGILSNNEAFMKFIEPLKSPIGNGYSVLSVGKWLTTASVVTFFQELGNEGAREKEKSDIDDAMIQASRFGKGSMDEPPSRRAKPKPLSVKAPAKRAAKNLDKRTISQDVLAPSVEQACKNLDVDFQKLMNRDERKEKVEIKALEAAQEGDSGYKQLTLECKGEQLEEVIESDFENLKV